MNKSKLQYDVLIIGGGVSGLRAAVELSAKGARVLLLEKNKTTGGRASSFFHHPTQSIVDNGQHLLLGCYHATREFLQLIGSEGYASLQTTLRIPYRTADSKYYELNCPQLPAPFHAVAGLLRFPAFSFSSRVKTAIVARDLFLMPKFLSSDQITVEEWLSLRHQTEEARKFLWDVLCVGAMNNTPEKVSAAMFARVVKTIFSSSRENSSFLLPHVPLQKLFADPAVDFITQRGGTVLTNIRVATIDVKDGMVHSVTTTTRESFKASSYILAVPWFAVKQLFSSRVPFPLPAYRSAPIINIHLWFNKPTLDQDFVALVGHRLQWIFSASRLLREEREHLSCVISSAEQWIEMPAKDILPLALADLSATVPAVREAQLLHWIVVKEKRATFVPAPGLEVQRPSAETEIKNLYLAGDWTATGYPATIEGAVLSGRRAALLCR